MPDGVCVFLDHNERGRKETILCPDSSYDAQYAAHICIPDVNDAAARRPPVRPHCKDNHSHVHGAVPGDEAQLCGLGPRVAVPGNERPGPGEFADVADVCCPGWPAGWKYGGLEGYVGRFYFGAGCHDWPWWRRQACGIWTRTLARSQSRTQPRPRGRTPTLG